MRTIDVHDLPEPVARAIETMVQSLRDQARAEATKPSVSESVQLPAWPGTVLGTLRRGDIYDDVKRTSIG
jgi:hypothetical protein